MQDLKKEIAQDPPKKATRKASQAVLEVINGVLPETLAGSADLTGSNNTNTSQTLPITPDDFSGRFIHYGIREHAMAAAMNGMALHGGLIPYSGGFLIFADYCRPSIRLAALMGIRAIHVMTHDSIGLGEGRADPSTGGTFGFIACDPEPQCISPGRYDGNRRVLAIGN